MRHTTHQQRRLLVSLPTFLWNELQLDNPDKYQRALCAFYLNMGVESVRQLLTAAADDPEVTELLRVAPLLGLTKRDRITKK